jgi:hypothetical protein
MVLRAADAMLLSFTLFRQPKLGKRPEPGGEWEDVRTWQRQLIRHLFGGQLASSSSLTMCCPADICMEGAGTHVFAVDETCEAQARAALEQLAKFRVGSRRSTGAWDSLLLLVLSLIVCVSQHALPTLCRLALRTSRRKSLCIRRILCSRTG